jgi:cytidylate kinase
VKKNLVIAIDGPAGAGKSSVGKILAERLGYVHLSTGTIYRAIGWKADRRGLQFMDIPAMEQLIAQTEIEFQPKGDGTTLILLDGNDASELLMTNEVGLLASAVAAIPEVRQGLLSLQRRAGKNGGVVLDGRDVGTVVFPNADVKFYLDASAEERAQRRLLQLQEQGIVADFHQLLLDIQKRDHDDSTREIAPLLQAQDAIYIDSSNLSCEAVVEKMLTETRKIAENY